MADVLDPRAVDVASRAVGVSVAGAGQHEYCWQ
jgi:hypothetical protein